MPTDGNPINDLWRPDQGQIKLSKSQQATWRDALRRHERQLGAGFPVAGRFEERPFAAIADSGTSAVAIKVGVLRDSGDYKQKDIITIVQADGTLVQVDKTSASESVNATNAGWAFYDVDPAAPSATLTFSTSWPPTITAGHVPVMICYNTWASGAIVGIYQVLTDSPTVYQTQDGLILVSANDTTRGYLIDKCGLDPNDVDVRYVDSAYENPIEFGEINDGADEDFYVGFDIQNVSSAGSLNMTDLLIVSQGVTSTSVSASLSDLQAYIVPTYTAGDGLTLTAYDFDVNVKNSIEIDSDYLQLVNDETSPGNGDVYGVSSGTKGWKAAATDLWTKTSADVDDDFCDDVDLSTTDQITFGFSHLDHDVTNGLTDVNQVVAAADKILNFDGVWVRQDGGSVYHDITAQGGAYDWFNADLALNGGGNIVFYFDDTGHLQKYDATSSPGGPQLHKYENCVDSGDIIWFSADQGAFIEMANGDCYQKLGVFPSTATPSTRTVITTHASCAACASALANFRWLKCSDDSALIIYDPGDTYNPDPTEFAWILSGGTYVKGYFANMTSAAAGADPCSKYPASPSACADLTIAEFSDDFEDGTVDTCLWTGVAAPSTSGFSLTESGGESLVTFNGRSSPTGGGRSQNAQLSIAGDFDVTIVVSTISNDESYNGYTLRVVCGSDYIYCDFGNTERKVYFSAEAGQDISGSVSYATHSVRMTRQSDNYFRVYVDGTLRATSVGTYSANVTEIWYGGFSNGSGAKTFGFESVTCDDTP